jgi:hypothetical protein
MPATAGIGFRVTLVGACLSRRLREPQHRDLAQSRAAFERCAPCQAVPLGDDKGRLRGSLIKRFIFG